MWDASFEWVFVLNLSSRHGKKKMGNLLSRFRQESMGSRVIDFFEFDPTHAKSM